jgi:hypothetical protein
MSESSPNPHRKLRPSGGYRNTASFQASTLIYDFTIWFCEKFLDSRSCTMDQMVQAARSGRQNIAEGSRAAATFFSDGAASGERAAGEFGGVVAGL